jgi:putative transposase
MHFEPNHIYHVYNRGNNKVKIFFTPANYLFLLKKIKAEWVGSCDILSYCLMPNHFHFMLRPKPEGCAYITQQGKQSNLQVLSKIIGKTLSSYTQAINIQNEATGTLFQKKTKAKCLTDIPFKITGNTSSDYLTNCFYYIHQNPIEAKLVTDLKLWPYSSWPDYYGYREGALCNKEILMTEGGFSKSDFSEAKQVNIDKAIIAQIW